MQFESNIYFKNNPAYYIELLNLSKEDSCGFTRKLKCKFSKRFNKSFQYLLNWINTQLPLLNETHTILTKCYWILNGLTDFPMCSQCGKKLINFNVRSLKAGYQKYCSIQCLNNNQTHKNNVRNTLKLHYGLDVKSSFQIPSVQQKIKKTNIERFNSEYIFSSQYGKQKIKETIQKKYGVTHNLQIPKSIKKRKITWLKKYGSEHILKCNQIKQKVKNTQLKHYGCYFCCSAAKQNLYKDETYRKQITEKIINTKRKNNTFNKSKLEDQTFQLLAAKYGKDNVIRQFKSAKYPFACDFYITTIDTYIECNYCWTHGGHFFNAKDENDLKKLQLWKSKNTKFYQNAIETWTIRDLNKLLVAKENNLNYLVFWNIDEAQQFLN